MSRLALTLLLACNIFAAPLLAEVLVQTNSAWNYHKGTSEPSADGKAWRLFGFDDSAWARSSAPFYYGEPITRGTLLSDMRNRYSTLYLRKEFTIDHPARFGSLELNLVSDDGCIVWINGNEVRRHNVTASEVPFNGFASSSAVEPVQFTLSTHSQPADLLVSGTNVIAVQALNINLSSSDLVIDLSLRGVLPDKTPPTVLDVQPEPGRVGGISKISIAFSEIVIGLDRLDLLLNETPAISVSNDGPVYTFEFPPTPPGYARVRWADEHRITDLAVPANPFVPGSEWEYELVDVNPPVISQIHPPPGARLRELSEIELLFDEPVNGIDAEDLVVNGIPAARVIGIASGPYRFEFAPVSSGAVELSWRNGHGITDASEVPNPFAPTVWSYTIDSTAARPALVINEIHAANERGLKDEEGSIDDWIEIYNPGSATVDLKGWSLTDEAGTPGKWVFPAVQIDAGQYLVVFASGKDRRDPSGRLHTNFKLSAGGEYVGLFDPHAPRQVVDELPEFPIQRTDHSYGRLSQGEWGYFKIPTPGTSNWTNPIHGIAPDVHFSVGRGWFDSPFHLTLSTISPTATIRYTLDGSVPTETTGLLYTDRLHITRTAMVRAAAFEPDKLPSRVETHTYLFGQPAARRTLPALSIVTDTNHLFGRTGIMSTSPRNTIHRGSAWERPVSAEWIRPEDNAGFQIDAGLRIQGGNYVRERYNPRASLPFSKYSFRLYFRGDYGESKLQYPFFPESPVQQFDRIVLRAGMNDHSNPFISDELVRRLSADTGQVASHGNLALLFLNGVYKGYYNPTERIDGQFLQSWHGGGKDWDIIAQFNEIREGDATQWNSLRRFISGRNLATRANFEEVARWLDLTNFVDYLLVNIYVATGDWPHNNWRAARERVPGSKFRFYVWDAEWSFGFRNPVSHNTLTAELNSQTDIGNFYRRLRVNPEFKLLFADRAHKHLFHGGALSEANVLRRFLELRNEMKGVLPNMNTSIQRTWIPRRPAYMIRHLAAAGLFASSNAPALSQHGGSVAPGYQVTMTAPEGTIYYTTNGADPRVAFTGDVSADALVYNGPVTLDRSIQIAARTLDGSNWSALTDASFQVAELGVPIRITELMYNPPGGDAFEFIELKNIGQSTIDLGFMSFDGIDFAFPSDTRIAPGEVIVIASDADPAAFASRYPNLQIAGRFNGALSNGGESIVLNDAAGRRILSVDYDDQNGWPTAADGGGHSIELIDPRGDPDDPANWNLSPQIGGSPGQFIPATTGAVLLNEIMAENASAVPNGTAYPDWIELANRSSQSVDLSGWSVTDNEDPRKFVLPPGTQVGPGAFLVIWCDDRFSAPGLHTGFGLNKRGERISLFDRNTNRIDAVTFGAQVADFSIGRVGDLWQLTSPTPNAQNIAAALAPSDSLRINEWLANPFPGEPDWIELFNTDASRPAALRGLYLSTGNALFQVSALAFLPPAGHAQLFADELPGPEHLDFKLSAAGEELTLRDSAGRVIDRVVFGSQAEGVSQGRLPDGSNSIVAFPGTASPGAQNYQLPYSGPFLNELMALNQQAVKDSTGRAADWIELFNPATNSALDLGGMSISLDRAEPVQWTFPSGVTLAPGAHLVVWADGSRPASTSAEPDLNLGRNLPSEGGGVYLFNKDGQVVDRIEYGSQVADRSVGRLDGTWHLLAEPTPANANAPPANLGDVTSLRLNEWMADPRSGNDWLEIYNPNHLPVLLSGLYLTDDPSIAGRTNYQFGPLTLIHGPGWLQLEAGGQIAVGPNHLPFSLARLGESLRLYTSSGALIDAVDFGPQSTGVSEGRLPDGATSIRQFPGSDTPGASNFALLTQVVINEVLTHTDPPLEDSIELLNTTGQPVDVSGWYLSDNATHLKKFRSTNGTVIPAKGFKVFYQYQFDPAPGTPESFTFNSARGDELHLSATDPAGELTGFRSVVRFGAAENGVSFGRYEASTGAQFVPMNRLSLGTDAPGTLAEFRSGTGGPNPYPRVGPVVINEIMYHPISGDPESGSENRDEEFIEVHNITSASVPLFDPAHPANTWRLAGNVEFNFPPGVMLGGGEFALIVAFDPAADSTDLLAFRTQYNLPANTRLFGPFKSNLSNAGGAVQLLKPDSPQRSGPDVGLVPYVEIDRVAYDDESPWTPDADGTGKSLQRVYSADFGNDPLNWTAAAATAGQPNAPAAAQDADNDGLPDAWETSNGLDPSRASDAGIDTDGDGMSNLQEFIAGTFPRNSQSSLVLQATRSTATSLVLQFMAAPDRSYALQGSSSLQAGAWSTVTSIAASPNSRFLEITLPVDANDADVRFYRVTVTR